MIKFIAPTLFLIWAALMVVLLCQLFRPRPKENDPAGKLIRQVIRRPIPGLDAHFLQWCPVCDSFESHASRGGYKIGGTLHCYTCGTETDITTIPVNSSAQEMITSSFAHWLKYPRIPYNWHELSEKERFYILGGS